MVVMTSSRDHIMGDIIPFRARSQKESSPPQAHNPLKAQKLKPPVPQEQIERFKHLAEARFLPPEEYFQSISDLSDAMRKQVLRREIGLLGSKMAYDHRVIVLVTDEVMDKESTYRNCYEVKRALDSLTTEFGRAAVYNAEGALIRFDQEGESQWRRDLALKKECLYLRPGFTEDDVAAVLRPRLKPSNDYDHPFYDVTYRNG